MIKIAILIIFSLSTISILFIQYKKEVNKGEEKPTKKERRKEFWLLIFGVICVLISGWSSGEAIYEQRISDSTAESYRNKFDSSLATIASLSKMNADSLSHLLGGQVTEMNSLINLSKQQQEANNSITGSSYIVLKAGTVKDKFVLKVENHTNYLARNVEVFVFKTSDLRKCIVGQKNGRVMLDDSCYNYSFFASTKPINIPPSFKSGGLVQLNLKTDSLLHYLYTETSTESGRVYEQIIFKLQDGKIRQAYRTYKIVNDNPVFIEQWNDLKIKSKMWDEFIKPGFTTEANL